MAHWARVENNLVTMVLVGDNSEPDEGFEFISTTFGGTWIKTSVNTLGNVYYSQDRDENGNRIPADDQSRALRYNYAGIGFVYDEQLDAFIPPRPHDSWVLNENTCLWEAPIEKPDQGDHYWSEDSMSWQEILWDEEA